MAIDGDGIEGGIGLPSNDAAFFPLLLPLLSVFFSIPHFLHGVCRSITHFWFYDFSGKIHRLWVAAIKIISV